MPEPKNTPTSSRFVFSRSKPESSKAFQPAYTPNCEKRSARRISFGEGKAGVGSKSLTSAAICVTKPDGSKDAILSTPQPPEMRLFQNLSMSFPKGETTPRPVTTTLRSVQLLAIKSNGAAQADAS